MRLTVLRMCEGEGEVLGSDISRMEGTNFKVMLEGRIGFLRYMTALAVIC